MESNHYLRFWRPSFYHWTKSAFGVRGWTLANNKWCTHSDIIGGVYQIWTDDKWVAVTCLNQLGEDAEMSFEKYKNGTPHTNLLWTFIIRPLASKKPHKVASLNISYPLYTTEDWYLQLSHTLGINFFLTKSVINLSCNRVDLCYSYQFPILYTYY